MALESWEQWASRLAREMGSPAPDIRLFHPVEGLAVGAVTLERLRKAFPEALFAGDLAQKSQTDLRLAPALSPTDVTTMIEVFKIWDIALGTKIPNWPHNENNQFRRALIARRDAENREREERISWLLREVRAEQKISAPGEEEWPELPDTEQEQATRLFQNLSMSLASRTGLTPESLPPPIVKDLRLFVIDAIARRAAPDLPLETECNGPVSEIRLKRGSPPRRHVLGRTGFGRT